MVKIYMMHNGIDSWAIRAAQAGIQEIIQSIGRGTAKNFGYWRTPDWSLYRTLQPYQSVDWYMKQSRRRKGPMGIQINAHDILVALWKEPWRKDDPHLDIFIVREDIYSDECDWCFGSGMEGVGCVISVSRWEGIGQLAGECITSMAVHELAHALGLLPENRVHNVEDALGKHCTNPGCIMRQKMTREESMQMTRDRIRRGPGRAFCPECKANLKELYPPGR